MKNFWSENTVTKIRIINRDELHLSKQDSGFYLVSFSLLLPTFSPVHFSFNLPAIHLPPCYETICHLSILEIYMKSFSFLGLVTYSPINKNKYLKLCLLYSAFLNIWAQGFISQVYFHGFWNLSPNMQMPATLTPLITYNISCTVSDINWGNFLLMSLFLQTIYL